MVYFSSEVKIKTLDEKRFINIPGYGLTDEFLPVKEVEKFIREIKHIIVKNPLMSIMRILDVIDERAGDGLIK